MGDAQLKPTFMVSLWFKQKFRPDPRLSVHGANDLLAAWGFQDAAAGRLRPGGNLTQGIASPIEIQCPRENEFRMRIYKVPKFRQNFTLPRTIADSANDLSLKLCNKSPSFALALTTVCQL